MQQPAPQQGGTSEDEAAAEIHAIDKASKHNPDRCKFTNLLPFLFVMVIIVTIYGIYIVYHCLPMLQETGGNHVLQGKVDFAIIHVLTLFLVICYARCIFVHPGTVPNTPKWRLDAESWGNPDPSVKMAETKRSGERRYCKWCARYKPDRCHHCRVCKLCILRMDHHCPWIMNCVGFRNHKYFFLLVFYSGIDCLYIAATMFSSVHKAINEETPFSTMYMLVFGETLCSLMALLVVVFFGFHLWLMSRATTTIEFCEKATKDKEKGVSSRSVYDCGFYQNTLAVLGPHPVLWFLPFSPPTGDGLSFAYSEGTPLLAGSRGEAQASSSGHDRNLT